MPTPDLPRKKSPRAPSMPLDEAVERALKIYERERVHAAPADVIAQHIGYKNASSGPALAALASLRYYGLIDRPAEGRFAVNRDVEAFKFAPSDELKRSFLRKFLAKPPLFAELLDKYAEGLPSDGTLRYELIQRGFLPGTAEVVVTVFKRSVQFVGLDESESLPDSELEESHSAADPVDESAPEPVHAPAPVTPSARPGEAYPIGPDDTHDRIPVRLSGGRRAWLVIPSIFHEADKLRLKAQIDLLLTEEDE